MKYLFFFLFPLSLFAQSPLDWVKDHPATIAYQLDLTDVQQHELHITVHFPAVPTGAFHVKMPTASPGRYAEHNFAKNVYDVQAKDGAGKDILVNREGINEWIVTGHDGQVKLSYTLFANGGDGTYAGVDNRKLHLNMPAVFLYGEQLNDRPVKLVLPKDQRPEWKVASQLEPIGDRQYAAPNYYYFYDSPTLVGEIELQSSQVKSGSRVATIEAAFMGETTPADREAYFAWILKIVAEQQRVYGELPAYDYGRYTFLLSYNPYIGGDGMEHRNSTVCSADELLAGNQNNFIGTVSHEFFHCWNVERIRPASLEPFEFDHANQSGELWFAEGFTSYYDDLTLVRTGILSPEDYFDGLTGMLNYVYLRPGRNHRNPIQMSQQAPFVDAATANDEDNFQNTFVSYYPYGATLALVLDLNLREREHTLDELMKLVWQRYGQPEIPYHVNDLERALADLTGDADWAKQWFQSHVYGSQLPDLAKLLEPYGVDVAITTPDSVGFIGLRLRDASKDNTGVRVAGKVTENNPLWAAGVDAGSVITLLNNQPITNLEDWDKTVANLQLGQTYPIGFTQLDEAQEGSFKATASPEFTLTIGKKKSKKRESWIGAGRSAED